MPSVTIVFSVPNVTEMKQPLDRLIRKQLTQTIPGSGLQLLLTQTAFRAGTA